MTAASYPDAIKWVLIHEGGYVNHPRDPGGATNRGVIQRTYDAYRRRMGLPVRSVREITENEVHAIYREQYWNAVRGNDLPAGVDYLTFDYGVNSGPGRAIKDLQRVVGARPDGSIGNETMQKVGEMPPEEIIRRVCERRMRFLRGLKHWSTFGRGWTRRVLGEKAGVQSDDIGVIDRAMLLALNAEGVSTPVPIPAPKAEAPGKATEDDVSPVTVVKDAAKKFDILGILGAFGSTIVTIATSSGPISWAVAGCLVGGGIYLVYRLERKERLAA
jgi:lysozyme family protein